MIPGNKFFKKKIMKAGFDFDNAFEGFYLIGLNREV